MPTVIVRAHHRRTPDALGATVYFIQLLRDCWSIPRKNSFAEGGWRIQGQLDLDIGKKLFVHKLRYGRRTDGRILRPACGFIIRSTRKQLPAQCTLCNPYWSKFTVTSLSFLATAWLLSHLCSQMSYHQTWIKVSNDTLEYGLLTAP